MNEEQNDSLHEDEPIKQEETNKNSRKKDAQTDPFKKTNKDDLKKIPSTLLNFVISIFSFSNDEDVNPVEVSESIKKSIEFRGYNVWVLICSIFIASIGLNLNSPAVIIGAMLISPLMGPIRGLGLAVGTNDFKLLIFSLINFGVATGVSILVSFIYFKLTPFKEAVPEVLGRTEPQILDVLIASFGGLAGIIAASKNDNSTVVPGVAIATALMPPLCVAGFGLATGNWEYFFGSFYLFILNSIFICLTTIIVIRYLKFPLVSYVNKKTERRIKIYVLVFLLLVLVPSGFKFAEVWNKSTFIADAELFIQDEIEQMGLANDFGISSKDIVYGEENQQINIYLTGNGRVSEARKKELDMILHKNYPKCELKIFQNKVDKNHLTLEDFNAMIDNYNTILAEKEKEIKNLEAKINSNTFHNLDMTKTEKWLGFQDDFKNLKSFSASNAYQINMNNKVDTVLLFRADWSDSTINNIRTKKLKDFIGIEFNTKKFELVETTSK